MPPDRSLLDTTAGADPQATDVQQLIEAEAGKGTQGVLRRWQASDSAAVVLTSDATGVKISRDAGATPPAQVIVDGTPAGGNLSGTYPNPTLSAAIIDALLPPGSIQAYAGAGFPAGWLPCNGSVVARGSYPKLFAVIGTSYNTGGEAGTDFRLPNLLGRVILGVSGTHPLAETGGTETGPLHTHPGSHSHGLNSHTHGPGLHIHASPTHSHLLTASHAHGPGSHTHGLNGHRHDIGHNHANAVGAAAASSSVLNGRFLAGGVNALPDTHTHDVDLPTFPPTDSGVPSASVVDTATPSTGDTGTVTGTPSTGTSLAADTGQPTAVDTGPPSAAIVVTATDSSAPAAAYTDTTRANLQPYLSVQYLIRTG